LNNRGGPADFVAVLMLLKWLRYEGKKKLKVKTFLEKNEKISLENGLFTFRIIMSVNDISYALLACESSVRNGILA